MFNSFCILNDVECELFMFDIEFIVNLSFIIKIWGFFYMYVCYGYVCLVGIIYILIYYIFNESYFLL